jgi:para-nitrobenzyl esterase
MKTRFYLAVVAGALGLASAPVLVIGQQPPTIGHATELVVKSLPPRTQARLAITSPSFKDGDDIPYEYTQYRGNIFPGLNWTAGPAETKSYVVIVQGESLSRAGAATSIHLTLFNIPAKVTALKTGMDTPPADATYGPNVHGPNQPYAGPHTHTAAKNAYHYEVFALDTALALQPTVEFEVLVSAMTGHVVASGDLVGVSAKDPNATESQAAVPVPTPIRIETGLLSGVPGREPSITAYKGIPYAAPPVGDLRFRPPQPPLPWQGVRHADQFGKSCAQPGPKDNMSEDCLFANVWTGAPLASGPRPVFVWIYGGAFTNGSGSDATFDGEALARKGLVVVTFNYRLGAFGFLATPELSKETGHNASGDMGLMDDIALLQWVHKNIAAFGGDPNRVTIGGQSAGAGSVGFLAMSPLAKGLFQGAIEESHARYSRDTELRYLSVSWRSLKDAEATGVKFQEAHGAHTLKELRALPWDQLIVTADQMDMSVETGSDAKPPLFRPVVDGWVLPKNYSQTYASGTQNNVAVIAGNNRDETGAVPENTFAQRRAADNGPRPGLPHINVTLAAFQSAAKRKFGPLADEFLKLYPASNDDEAALQSNEAARDNSRVSTYLWGTDWTLHATKPVYTYFWTHRPTGDPGGAHHGSEILFVFNNLYLRNQKWTEEDLKVADTVSSYWANFAATGNPNGPTLPAWAPYNPQSPTVMEIGDHFGPIPVASSAKLDFWKRFFQTQQPW